MNIHPTDWQQSLAEAFTSIDSLCNYLKLATDELNILPENRGFPLKVPREFAERMEVGNPADPLLRQVLPIKDELLEYPGYSHDPVGDLAAVAEAGVIHKYHGRVLLIATGACAVHCRYCFRRNFPYAELQLSRRKLQQALSYIANRHEISEVILSGGDPLLLSDEKLEYLLRQVAAIPHVRRVRIHSRVPIVLPNRINERLLDTLSRLPKQVVLVFHANHPNELSTSVGKMSNQLRSASVTLLNQSVLLKDVNNTGSVLCELSERLFAIGVLPYYLHLLDKASGAAHFEISKAEASMLLQHMQQKLPGYLVPKLVEERPGAAYKMPIC